jgi:hypothetical protein
LVIFLVCFVLVVLNFKKTERSSTSFICQ